MKHKTTLVEHLRSVDGVGRWTTSMHEAADLIERQAKQLAEQAALIALLRDALEFMWRDVPMNDYAFERCEKALAATDDLSHYILCEKEPVAHVDEDDDNKWATLVDDLDIRIGTPLYRAKEQEK